MYLVSAPGVNPLTSRSVVEMIRQRSEDFLSAIKSREIQATVNFVAEDAVILPPSRPAISGSAAINEFVKSLLDAGLNEITVQQIDLQHAAGLVIEIGYYTMQAEAEAGKALADKGKYITSWRRQADGEYRITSSIWSSDVNVTLYQS